MSLEFFLAGYAAEMEGFALVGYFKLGCVFVKNHATDWVSELYFSLTSWNTLCSTYYG